ncbi:SDR family oxidoreductase [Bradyrhizobium barranii subsp. barranii]|uniref:dTDP-4-dehydrorhamnose reductase n=1 Tax=Bradyrhizobium barranii subsp. barranii TaxID=2823807 RepID=A0A7Z0QF06_9BRAD|nr:MULTISPECIES: SDR family oxidoreductase [Bradyrhizobium]UEM17957.1 SDR family oxidoreductase [Bradyrhizobium barranii subsp. barranii]UGX91775.1 SDR family oxidoreductase [Bradyrhizobium barranii subsp. barranii]UQE03593.1 SDR family oxidoreductase [Bradyrhizobium japonicum]
MITENSNTTVLVLGATGMLGNAMFRGFAESAGYRAFGSTRSKGLQALFPEALRSNLISDIDVENVDALSRILTDVRPDVVINCVGLIKQLSEAKDPLAALPINALLPHRLARLCRLAGARLVHISTDCVFDGVRGNYSEEDRPNADDLYGRSKLLGEVDYENAVTLRTSIIGHELNSAHGLIGWFLSQSSSVKGFTKAIFSGLPTAELMGLVRDFVLPDRSLRGLYHVSAAPISKYELLRIVADNYGRAIDIVPDETLVIDRSLDSSRFRRRTGYQPPEWPALVRIMRDFG